MWAALAAGIAATAGLIGNAISSNSANKTNASNRRLMELSNQFTEHMYDRQVQDQNALIDKLNAYNTPAAQRQRLESAGFNPYLMMSQGNTGNASSASAPSAGTSAQATMHPFQPDMSWAGQMAQYVAQEGVLHAQAENIAQDAAGKQIDNMWKAALYRQQIDNIAEQTRNYRLKNVFQDLENGVLGQSFNSYVAYNRARVESLAYQNNLFKSQEILNRTNARIQSELAPAQLAGILTGIDLTKAQTKRELASMLEINARTRGFKISNDVAQALAQSMIDSGMARMQYESDYFGGTILDQNNKSWRKGKMMYELDATDKYFGLRGSKNFGQFAPLFQLTRWISE